MVQSSLVTLGELSSSKEELYLDLDKLKQIQNNLSSSANEVAVQESLKDYKDLGAATYNMQLANRHYTSAIGDFMDYLNKDDMKKLVSAKESILNP